MTCARHIISKRKSQNSRTIFVELKTVTGFPMKPLRNGTCLSSVFQLRSEFYFIHDEIESNDFESTIRIVRWFSEIKFLIY